MNREITHYPSITQMFRALLVISLSLGLGYGLLTLYQEIAYSNSALATPHTIFKPTAMNQPVAISTSNQRATVQLTDFCDTATSSTSLPYLDMVPSLDGTELLVRLAGNGGIGETTVAEVGIGPTGHVLSWTDTTDGDVITATVPGLTPVIDLEGNVTITTTVNPAPITIPLYRAYIPTPNDRTINSPDGVLELTLINTDTFSIDSYILIMSSLGMPGAQPLSHCLIGQPYNIRAADDLPNADQPMPLRLYFDTTTLGTIPAHTLAIFRWNNATKAWDHLGGQLPSEQNYLALAIQRFGTYALMTTPAWRDEFSNLRGLNFPAETANITIGGPDETRSLVLRNQALTGTAVSLVITPTLANFQWDTLYYTTIATAPTTTVTIDLLRADNTLIRQNVPNGASLADLDPQQYPSLKLRANLTSTVPGESPLLDSWQLSWRANRNSTYLPMIVK